MSSQLIQTKAFLFVLILGGMLVQGSVADEGTRYPLFNGQNLDGWIVTGCQVGVENGALILQDGDGLVRTEHRYRDFVLELKWRARKSADFDSGIYFRSDLPPAGKTWPARYQANLKQGQEGNVGGLAQATSKGLAKLGDWNAFKLTVIGDVAKMEINGQPAWETKGVEPRDGYIALQSEVPLGGQYEFKDMFITELGYRPIFNGSDLAGWQGAGEEAAKCWKVEDGLLVCTGEKGPWLRSTEEHGDFNLRLEYRLNPGGNSGVYVRVPENGEHHGDGAGVEIQVLDDKSDRYKELKPYQYTGSVYAIAPAEKHVGREAGRWNTLEIDVSGASYRIIHNGVSIVTADANSFPELAKRKMRGFLGLQNHSEQVWYRNVRMGRTTQTELSTPTGDEKRETKP